MSKQKTKHLSENELKSHAIRFAVFINNDTANSDFCFMSPKQKEDLYQEFLQRDKGKK